MTVGGKSFSVVVLSSLAAIIGARQLFSGMMVVLAVSEELVQAEQSGSAELLVGSSAQVTILSGVLLLFVAGGFAAKGGLARISGIGVFVLVSCLNQLQFPNQNPIIVVETIAMVIAALYLLRTNPFANESRTEVDETTSAARIGSTLK